MNGVMLDLGFVQIYWYSICIVLGMAVGMAFVYSEASKKGISESAMTDIIFYTVLIAIIGARLWYVIFEWGKYQNNIIAIIPNPEAAEGELPYQSIGVMGRILLNMSMPSNTRRVKIAFSERAELVSIVSEKPCLVVEVISGVDTRGNEEEIIPLYNLI